MNQIEQPRSKKVDLSVIKKSEEAVLCIEQSRDLSGQAELVGAKNAVLVMIASLLLTDGKSTLKNVPGSDDVLNMIKLMEALGASVVFNELKHELIIDTATVSKFTVPPSIMKKMRASVLVMGPLLARFSRADIALPGGCSIGQRPIDFHLKTLKKMGMECETDGEFLHASCKSLKPNKIVLEYPSVGATENLLMAAVLTKGTTVIINASLEPEVFELVTVLKKMGADIVVKAPANIVVEGVDYLKSVEHTVMNDRLEAGAFLLAAAASGGQVELPEANVSDMEVLLLKLDEMGHSIETTGERGVWFKAVKNPRAVSFRTGPYPGFPTDLQAPMMAVQCLSEGESLIQETVFENRFLHIRELQKMGAQITQEGSWVKVKGVDQLYGAHVIASDIRASCALVIAGLAAQGLTAMAGIHHWRRGYEALEEKLVNLGAKISLKKASY